MRAAIYFTPPAAAGLTRAAALWLGRDAFTGKPTRDPDPARDALVAEPARYGFHATIRAPFRLAAGATLGALDAALDAFAARTAPVRIPALALRRIRPFFALVPEAGMSPALSALEAATLEAIEPMRASLTAEERARRRPERLTERQRAHLDRWGYPYVLDEFRFHMTLTGPVPDPQAPAVEAMLTDAFAPFIGAPLAVDALAVFTEPEPGAPFVVHARHALRGGAGR